MKLSIKATRSLLLTSVCGLVLAACASHAPTNVPKAYLEGTPLDRNAISVEKRTEFLEIAIDPATARMTSLDRRQIESFVDAYRDHGHGQLILSLPKGGANSQYAMEALTEARAIAWENGVEYEEIAGSNHDVSRSGDSTLILAFQTYDAIAPNCPNMANFDLSDISNNNELSNFGCAVRTNVAAMIADPADLLGQRELGQGDNIRRQLILERFRLGQPTGSTRGADESGAVSSAVN